MSLRELWMEFAVARRRAERTHRQEVTSAWYRAALTRVTELPPLHRLLGTSARTQTMTEQRIALTMIFGHSGRRVPRA